MSKYPTLEEARKSLKIRWYRTKPDAAVRRDQSSPENFHLQASRFETGPASKESGF